MQRDAQSHAAESNRRRELAEARNAAEQRVHQLQKPIAENKDRLSDANTAAVRSAIERVAEVKAGDNPAEIRRAVEDLEQASQALMQHLQGGGARATAGSRATSDGSARGPQSDDIIDLEFEAKK